MAGADISVIYEVRRHLSTCTVSCSRTFGTYNTTGNRAQAGRLLRCHRQRHQTTCEPTELGLMNGVLPFLFRLWKIIVAALRAPPGDLLSRCRPTTVPRSPSSSLSLSLLSSPSACRCLRYSLRLLSCSDISWCALATNRVYRWYW